MYLRYSVDCAPVKGRGSLSFPMRLLVPGHSRCSGACVLILWFIMAGAVVLLRLLAFPVRSGRCRNPGQKAIPCASQSSSPVGSLVWMWCDDHAAQRPGLCSQAQKWLLSHARPAIDCILVQEWRRPSSHLQSLLYISVAVFSTWP